jgi:very-short-patch-repair endonuclease
MIGNSHSEGVRHLRGYLDFAQRGMDALALDLSGSQGDVESPFEQDVLNVIRGMGYDAVPQVGSAGYRIDLAVLRPELPGRYVLAVECDGAAYHSAKAARDRDRLREQVLTGLGWTVHRIWGISWVRDRAGQIERLRKAIETSIDGDATPLTPLKRASREASVIVEEVDFDAAPEWAVPYRRGRARSFECPYDPAAAEARPYLRGYFEQLLRTEAPVHEDVLLRALRDDWGIGRIRHVIKRNVSQALEYATVEGTRVTRDEHGFYRLFGREITAVRLPESEDTVRPVGHVPPEELELAVVHVVRDSVVAESAQIALAVSRHFGWRRQGLDIQAAVQSALSRLQNSGALLREDNGEYSVSPPG